MTSLSTPSYISSSAVESLLLSKPSKADEFLIIDVRTSDYPGGHIRSSLNLSSRLFSSPTSIQSIISTHITPRLPKLKLVICHCMRSQYRGPMAASNLLHHSDWPKEVEVKVLAEGYRGWERKYWGRNDLFEGLEGQKGQVVGEKREDWKGEVEELHSVELRKAKGE